MTRRIAILAAVLIAICAFQGWAQDSGAASSPRSGPALTGFMLYPTSTDTCNPVRLSFTVTNYGSTPILSQGPYSDFVYPLYSSYRDMGFGPQSNRYMIGVSLDGGRDGYPFRWGFGGRLLSRRSATVTGFVAVPEVGSFTFTPALMLGNRVVARLGTRTATAIVSMCRPYSPPRQGRVVFPPVIPVYPPVPSFYGSYPPPPAVCGPGCYPAFIPYTVNGQLLVSASPFVYTLGAEITWYGGQIIINKPGIHLVLFAGSTYGILNGVPIYLPATPQFYGGVPYIPPQFISPILGATVFRDPLTGILYIRGPAGW